MRKDPAWWSDRAASRGRGGRGCGGAATLAGNVAGVVGQIYINDNTAPVNTVAGFDRHADGTLTAIPGSPFAVGGAGTGPRRRLAGLARS